VNYKNNTFQMWPPLNTSQFSPFSKQKTQNTFQKIYQTYT